MAEVKIHDIKAEVEELNGVIDEIEKSSGRVGFTLAYFGGHANESELLDALKGTVKDRGYEYDIEYDDDEILLSVYKDAEEDRCIRI